MQFEMI